MKQKNLNKAWNKNWKKKQKQWSSQPSLRSHRDPTSGFLGLHGKKRKLRQKDIFIKAKQKIT